MDTPLDELCASRGLRRALDPRRLARRHGDDEGTVVIALLTAAVRFLTYTDGAAVASETLRATVGRVERGEFRERLPLAPSLDPFPTGDA